MKKLLYHVVPVFFLLATFGLLFIILFGRMFLIDSTGAYVSHQHNWSDWGLHIAMINSFAYKPFESWFTQHLIFAGAKFTYPFVTNMISALFVRAGFSLTIALIFPSIVFALFSVVGMYIFSFLLLKDRLKSVLASTVFFLSGGPGFLRLIEPIQKNGLLAVLSNIPDFYTSYAQYQWYSGNVISGLFLPQRAFLLGFCVGIWILIFLLTLLQRPFFTKSTRVSLYLLGLSAGLLPIIHMHTFIVLVFFCGAVALFSLSKWKHFALFALGAMIVSVSVYFVRIHGGIANQHFFSFDPWYTSEGGVVAWVFLWWKLWGVAIPLVILSIFLDISKTLRSFLVGAVALFLLCNFFLLQPIAWDNSKIFFWVYAIFSIAIAHTLVFFFRKRPLYCKVIALVLCVFLCLGGVLDIVKIFQGGVYGFQLNSIEDIHLGEEVRVYTHPDAVFATAATIHNPIMDWGGRSVLLSYWAWAWNFGFDYEKRNSDIQEIFLGGSDALSLLQKRKVSYVVIGPAERNDYHANEEFFSKKFPIAIQSDQYRIYDVRSLTDAP